ncbi:hypothetical protein ACAG39_04975 [Caldicellulosiruptoraceae bacterium PP1]
MKKYKINYKRFYISVGILLILLILITALFKTLFTPKVISQDDYLSYIEKVFRVKKENISNLKIAINLLPDQSYLYKYNFDINDTYYEVYLKENKQIVYFNKTAQANKLSRFTVRDAKREGFRWLYKLAPYTKGNVDIYVEETNNNIKCNFVRIESDKKVLDNWAHVIFNKDNGDLINFEINWFKYVTFNDGVKKGNERDILLNNISIFPVIDTDSEIKLTTLNNILGYPNIYYEYTSKQVFPKVKQNKEINLSTYNSYIKYAQAKSSLKGVELKIEKILNLLSNKHNQIYYSKNKLKFASSWYKYEDNSNNNQIKIELDGYGNILSIDAKLKKTVGITDKINDIRTLNDKAEQVFKVITGKYIDGRNYRTTQDTTHEVLYKLSIGNIDILNGKMNIVFDKKSGIVLIMQYNLGFKPEFLRKIEKIENVNKYIDMIKAQGFEEKYKIAKDYGKVYLYEQNIDANLVLTPKFNLNYMLNIN